MKSIKLFWLFSIALLLLTDVRAQVGINKLAQSTMNFQLVSISPKASALGDAYYTLGKGAESIFYNPAGLAEMKNNYEVVMDYTQWIADINYVGGAFAYNMGNWGVVGLSILNVDYGTIYGTQLDPSKSSALGYIETGELSNIGAYSIGFSYAKSISEQFSIGGNIRYVAQNLGDNTFMYTDGSTKYQKNNAAKIVFDAGVKYKTGFHDFSFGMAIRNFSSNIKREAIDEQLPLAFTMGAAINALGFVMDSKEQALYVAVDFLHPNNYSDRVNLGLEYRFMQMFALRGGYQTNRDIASWSAGLGVNTNLAGYDVEINYSISKMEVFDNVNRVSVNLAF